MKKLLAAIAVIAAAGCTQIDTGNVGVESTLGQVKESSLPAGVYFTLFKTVHEVSAKEIPVELKDLQPKTSDNVTLSDLDVVVYYRISSEQVSKIFIRYAGDMTWSDQSGAYILGQGIVSRLSRESAYRAAAKYHSSDAHTKRTEIAADIRESLQRELDGDVGKLTFQITNVIIRNLVTDPKLEQAIKESAEVEFQIRRKRQQIELAKQEAERQRVEAEGQAKANTIIANSLSRTLIDLRMIEATREFARQGTHTVLLPQGTTPLVQVK